VDDTLLKLRDCRSSDFFQYLAQIILRHRCFVLHRHENQHGDPLVLSFLSAGLFLPFIDAEGAIIRYNCMIRKTIKSRRPHDDPPGHKAVHDQTLLFTFYPTTSDSYAGEPSPLSGILQQYQGSYMLDYRHRLSRLINVERLRALGQIVESGRFFFDIDSLSDLLK
jgi:hypothetical protein